MAQVDQVHAVLLRALRATAEVEGKDEQRYRCILGDNTVRRLAEQLTALGVDVPVPKQLAFEVL